MPIQRPVQGAMRIRNLGIGCAGASPGRSARGRYAANYAGAGQIR